MSALSDIADPGDRDGFLSLDRVVDEYLSGNSCGGGVDAEDADGDAATLSSDRLKDVKQFICTDIGPT